MPYVEAFRQFQFKIGHDNICIVHVSLIPKVSFCLKLSKAVEPCTWHYAKLNKSKERYFCNFRNCLSCVEIQLMSYLKRPIVKRFHWIIDLLVSHSPWRWSNNKLSPPHEQPYFRVAVLSLLLHLLKTRFLVRK